MRWLALLLLAVAVIADAAPRSQVVLRDFQRHNPCPSTDARRGACPGWEIDHVIPLCAGGLDRVGNLQWLTREQHSLKTKFDVMSCRLKRSPFAEAEA